MFYFWCNNVSPFKDINHSFAYIITTQFPTCLSFSGRKMDLQRGYTPHTEVHYAVDLNTIILAAYPQARGVCAPATRHLPRDSSLKFHQIFHCFRSHLLLVNFFFFAAVFSFFHFQLVHTSYTGLQLVHALIIGPRLWLHWHKVGKIPIENGRPIEKIRHCHVENDKNLILYPCKFVSGWSIRGEIYDGNGNWFP